jgi:hypothetical protein
VLVICVTGFDETARSSGSTGEVLSRSVRRR